MSEPAGIDPFELLKRLWAPMGLPMAGMALPALDIDEIDRRIAELKSVESWLNLNLGVLRMTLQGLEMQRATLVAMRGGATAPRGDASGTSGNPLADAWWNVLQGRAAQGRKETDPSKE